MEPLLEPSTPMASVIEMMAIEANRRKQEQWRRRNAWPGIVTGPRCISQHTCTCCMLHAARCRSACVCACVRACVCIICVSCVCVCVCADRLNSTRNGETHKHVVCVCVWSHFRPSNVVCPSCVRAYCIVCALVCRQQ